jgi:hypothetical protein
MDDRPAIENEAPSESQAPSESEAPSESQAPLPDLDPAVVEKTSGRYIRRWSRLVSTTNWEKGRIISQWRKALLEAEASPPACSDDAWSRRVGGVSPQHVGRLRRVYERFSQVYRQYRGLYWSHFQAALDWPDAEMWLEGAVQNRWSVAQMRTTRWDAIGAPPDKKPKPGDIVAAEWDEDIDLSSDDASPPSIRKSQGTVREAGAHDAAAAEPVPALDNVPPLPDDLAMAFEAFQHAILRHKRSGWRQIARQQVLAALDALRRLALAPPGHGK